MDLKHEQRLTEVEERSKSNTKRLDAMERRQNTLDELVGTVKALAVREENVESDVKEIKGETKEIKTEVKELASKPGKRWDALVDKIILTIAAALIGFLLAQIGL